MTKAGLRSAPPVRICWAGQSMLQLPLAPLDVPYMASSRVGAPWVNIAHAGEGWEQLLDEHLAELQAAVRSLPGCVDVLAMDGGQGDILNVYPATPTAQHCYDVAVAYAEAGRAAGFDYVGVSTMANLGPLFGRLTPAEQIVWDATNALLVADPDGAFDIKVRCDTVPFVDATNPDYFEVDRTHLTPLGGFVKATRWAEQLTTLPPFA